MGNRGRSWNSNDYAPGLRVTCLSGCEDGKTSRAGRGRYNAAGDLCPSESDLTLAFLKTIHYPTMHESYEHTRMNKIFFGLKDSNDSDQYRRQQTIWGGDTSLYRNQRPYIQTLTNDAQSMGLSFDGLLENNFWRSMSSNVANRLPSHW